MPEMTETNSVFMLLPPYRCQNQWRALQILGLHRSQSQQLAVGLQVLLDSGAPSSGTAGHSTMTRHCLKVGLANSNRGRVDVQLGSLMST